MKKRFALLAVAALVCGAALNAQTPEEIVRKMSAQMERTDAEGFTMDLYMKMPIVGESRTHTMTRGGKTKMEINVKDKQAIIWTDETAMWYYDLTKGEVSIKTREPSKSPDDDKTDLDGFDDIADGYDLTLEKETAAAWYILCKKSKSNKDKDDPKKMNLAVSKATYLPIYIKMKQSVVTVSMENITIGVTEESVTFNPADYPGVRIIDNR